MKSTMKNTLKRILILSAISLLIALVGTLLIYKVFPQYLCYEVYDVHEGNVTSYEDRKVLPGEQYEVAFIPQMEYIKSIAINVNQSLTAGEISHTQPYEITATLTDGQGKVLTEDTYVIEKNDVRTRIYCDFVVEKWMKPEEQYLLTIRFPNENSVYATFIGQDACSEEHISLQKNGELCNDALYMRYVYGTYSKKILVLWFAVFFLISYWLGNAVTSCKRRSTAQNKASAPV